MTAAPYAEVLGVPYVIYVAPVGTGFPDIDVEPAAPWSLLGTNGINNMGADGVTINVGSTESEFVPAGLTLPVKSWRTEEKSTVMFTLADLTVETFAAILDNATVSTVPASAGVAGYKETSLVRGPNIEYIALLARGLSPYDDGSLTMNAQYKFTRVGQTGSQAPKYVKGTPAELAAEFTIYGDVAGNDPALYQAQTDAATS